MAMSITARSPVTPRPPRPKMNHTNSFQKQLVTSCPTPPSLVHSPYLDSPRSMFRRQYETSQRPLPNEHDKLGLMDTIPAGEYRVVWSSKDGGSSTSGGQQAYNNQMMSTPRSMTNSRPPSGPLASARSYSSPTPQASRPPTLSHAKSHSLTDLGHPPKSEPKKESG